MTFEYQQKSTIWQILTENLAMTHICAKFIPKQPKNLLLEIAKDNLESINSDKILL